MEYDKPFSNVEFHLFPRIERAARFVLSICRNTNVPMHMSNHYNREHFVDDGQPRLPFGERE